MACEMSDLPDEVLVAILRHLPVLDLLTMRKVSRRHGRIAREKAIWRWTRIGIDWSGMVPTMQLYRDKDHFTGGGSTGYDVNLLMVDDLGDVSISEEELAWILCRVREADLRNFNFSGDQKKKIFQLFEYKFTSKAFILQLNLASIPCF